MTATKFAAEDIGGTHVLHGSAKDAAHGRGVRWFRRWRRGRGIGIRREDGEAIVGLVGRVAGVGGVGVLLVLAGGYAAAVSH